MYKTILGIALVIFALAIAIIPVFTQCDPMIAMGKTTYMKCHWSALAEITIAAPLLVSGAMFLITRKKEGLYILSILGIVVGFAAILVPTLIIGVCPTGMPCHTVMQPSLVILGSLTVVGCVGGLVLAHKADA